MDSKATECKLFPRPILTASTSYPREGNPVTLTCKIHLPPQKSDVQLRFCFFRESQSLKSGCSSSPELQIPTVWSKDSGSYWCEAQMTIYNITKRSPRFQIRVQRVPISDVRLETHPMGRWVMEGDKLVLVCSVAKGTGDITFFWYRGVLGLNLEAKTLRSLTAELEITSARERDADQYYCAADNGYGPGLSGLVNVTVRRPVSRPVLTLRAREQAVAGDVLELHCEALRGSPPILYRFYFENVTLGNRSAPSGGGASFNLSLTAEHSGNYSCEADNGRRAQRSEVVPLQVTVPVGDRSNHLTPGVTEGLLGSLGLVIVILSFCFWIKRKIAPTMSILASGTSPHKGCAKSAEKEHSPTDAHPHLFNLQEEDQLGIHSVNVGCGDEVYSLVYHIQQEQKPPAAPISMQAELFLHPVLIASSLQPTEGGPVTLTCKTWLPPQKSHVQLQVRFFRDSQALGSGWSSSPKFQISAVRPEDSGFYWCEASTVSHRIRKQSFQFKIHVQRIPIFNVNLETQTPGGEVIEGGKLLLLCSVAEGTGNITFFWYRANIETNLGRKTRGSLSAELEIPVVKESDSGEYYCEADNGYGPTRSKVVDILVRIPVSRPGFILRTSEAQLVAGDVVELHCEALRGSPPILYRFYFENVTLGNRSAPSGGGASFNLSLTAEHSGNYSCEADNGLGAQQSEVVTLSVSGPVSRPILILETPRAQAVVGDVMELHCEVLRGSTPILYQFYRGDVILGTSTAPFGGRASFNLSLTAEHSGNYSCEADNGLGAQHSPRVSLKVTVPVSRPVLTFGGSEAGAVEGDVVELHCEALRGSPPILYQFYYENVTLGNSSALAEGGVSFQLSLTVEHSGNYSCEADNGLGPQRSESKTLSVTGGLAALPYILTAAMLSDRQGYIPHPPPQLLHCSQVRYDEPVVIYAKMKKAPPDNLAEQTSRRGSAQEDATGNYENI
ncbi:Fc receptor-like protein 3 [Ctenodactylus gundi]